MATSTNFSVFISFQGELRTTFISHLYEAFRRKGVKPFIDSEELHKREKINVLMERIEQSKTAVVLLSENYSTSTWYLDELVKIMECWQKNNLKVIPVFYGVPASDVKHQTGKFGELFKNQEEIFQEKVPRWRKALETVCKLRGVDSESYSDSQLCEEIVRVVTLYPTDEKYLIGIDSRVQKIESLLSKQTSDVHSLGIWGMAGIGKTSIAKATFDKISGDYEACYFLRDFDERVGKDGLYGLREQFFNKILGEEVHETDLNPGIIHRLQSKKILVVLDDVRHFMDAKYLVGGFDWFGPGSSIIVTSRDKQVFVQCQIKDIYRVKGLDNEESQQLFSRYAFRKDKPEKDFLEISMTVIKYADGNPLALQFYGQRVNSKTPLDFEMSFLKLKQRPSYPILDVLRRSYDVLDDNEKNIFLDLACFFRGENLVRLKPLLEGCGFFADVGIKILVERSLITVSDNVVEMHNLFQDVGREIVRRQSENPTDRCRLWDPSAIRHVLEKERGTGAIEGMFLDTANLSFDISKKAFENIYNLRLLKIHCTDPGNQPGVQLPEGLECLPDELRLLHWENYPLNFLPHRFDPRNLVELNLPGSRIEKLWEGTKSLEKLGKITLCQSQQLTEIPELSEARNLKHADLKDCSKLQAFPRTVCLEYLEVLNLSGCSSIEIFPEISPNIKELYLGGTDIREVSTSIENLSRIVKLDLEKCTSLETLPSTICKLKNLELLKVSGCSKLESFPEIAETMRSLLYLDLSETGIKGLPFSFSKLVALEELRLKDCENLSELPDILYKLKTLRKVEIRDEIIDWSLYSANHSIDLKDSSSSTYDVVFMALTPYSLMDTLLHNKNELELTSGNDLEKLLSHGSSLETISFSSDHQIASPYIFTNSSNLDRGVIKEIFIKEVNRIQRMEEEKLQELSETPSFTICFPATIHPEWSTLVATGYSAFLHLPCSAHQSNPVAFAFFIVVSFKEDFCIDHGFAVRCSCTVKIRGREYNNLERIFGCWSQGEGKRRIQEDLMFIFYDYYMHQYLFEGCDDSNESEAEIRFEFYPVDENNKRLAGCKVKQSAVYMTTARHENNKIIVTWKQSSSP